MVVLDLYCLHCIIVLSLLLFPEAVCCPPSISVDVHPFRYLRWYVPSWPFSGVRSVTRAHLGPQPWTGPLTRLCSQYDGTQPWTWNTQRTSWHAGTKWLLSGRHVSYAQGTASPLSVTVFFVTVAQGERCSIYIRVIFFMKSKLFDCYSLAEILVTRDRLIKYQLKWLDANHCIGAYSILCNKKYHYRITKICFR